MVFNTSMTGYQEVLTDPSYAGQIVCMTYPLIGNYGVNSADAESSRPWVEGFVVREASHIVSNWRSEESLDAYLKRWKIVAIEGIDTRALIANVANKRTSIDPFDSDNLPAVQICVQTFLPTPRGNDMACLSDDEPFDLRQGRLRIGTVNSVVANKRIGHTNNLSGVRGVR